MVLLSVNSVNSVNLAGSGLGTRDTVMNQLQFQPYKRVSKKINYGTVQDVLYLTYKTECRAQVQREELREWVPNGLVEQR